MEALGESGDVSQADWNSAIDWNVEYKWNDAEAKRYFELDLDEILEEKSLLQMIHRVRKTLAML